jgi:K+-sensing histidine kinase KdpD
MVDALLAYVAGPGISEANDTLVYLGGSILAALYLGRGPALLASLESLLMLSEVHQRYRMLGPQELWQLPLSFALFLFTIHQISSLSDRARREAWKDRQRGEVLELLSDFGQLCAEANTLSQVRQILLSTCGTRLGLQVDWLDEVGEQGIALQGAVQSYGCLSLRQPVSPFVRTLLSDLAHHAALTMDRIQQADQEHRTSMLEATQKLQSALINSLSHDLQTPLSSILGVFEALQSPEVKFSEEQSQRLTLLGQQQSERLLRLVRNLLNVGKLEGGALKLCLRPILLEDVVRSALRSLPRSDAQRIRLACQGEEVEVQGDAVLLHQVVFNLLDNALKFSPSDQEVELHLWRQEDQVFLEVLDRGFGIAEQDCARIYERFFRGTTPRQVPGSGLGLHICKVLAELHRGDLSYRPRAEGGSCFRLSLPGHREEPIHG